MAGVRWEQAQSRDLPSCETFMLPHESWACSCSDRIRQALRPAQGRAGGSAVRLILARQPDNGRLEGLVCNSGGLVFPVLPGTSADWSDRLDRLGSGTLFDSRQLLPRPYSCVGAPEQLDLLEQRFGWLPDHAIAYDAMVQGDALPEFPPMKGLLVRSARPEDLQRLLPLAEAYEREEVLTPLHSFNPDNSRAAQINSLAHYSVYVAELDGRLVGRAQTNAHGFRRDQIGGVYVLPELRGRGIASLLMRGLLSHLNHRGRMASLFVKQTNLAARTLYDKLGFVRNRDYRIDYFT